MPVSQVCDKHGVSIVNFYNWQKQFFENGAAAFERKPNSANVRRQQDANVAKIEMLEKKLQEKNEVTGGQIQKWIGIWSSTYCGSARNQVRGIETAIIR